MVRFEKAALILLLAAGPAHAAWTGKLDLTPDVAALVARTFQAAPDTLGGLEKPIWSLRDQGYPVLTVAPLVGWESAEKNNRVLGGLDVSASLGTLSTILRALGTFQTLPPSAEKLDAVLSRVNTGVILAWDPRFLAPAFVGYKISVQMGGK